MHTTRSALTLVTLSSVRRTLLPLAVAAALLTPRSPLAADSGWERADAYYAPEPAWYGWPLLAVDALSVGALVYGIDQDRTGYIVGGSLGFLLGGPTIHSLRGHGGAALQSLGRRVGGPLGFGYVALRIAEAACDGDTRCGVEWGLGGLAAGAAFAIIADLTLGPGDLAVAPMVGRDARGEPLWGMAIVAR